MSLTRTQFQEAVQNYLDSTGVDANLNATTSTPRWDKTTINAVGGNVFQEEWSNILDANQAYRFAKVSVTTDANGAVAVANLTTGAGDTAQNFYRVLSGFSDGTVLYRETDYRNVPLGTTTNYNSPWDYLYYLAGANFQILPVQASLALTCWVNWTPPRIDQLSGDSVAIDFPDGAEYLLVWQTAARLLLKGGVQTDAAQALSALANEARKNLLARIGRLTTRPNFLMFADRASTWGA